MHTIKYCVNPFRADFMPFYDSKINKRVMTEKATHTHRDKRPVLKTLPEFIGYYEINPQVLHK